MITTDDIMKSLTTEEKEMIMKGKKHWDLGTFREKRGGYMKSEDIKTLIDLVIENTWVQAKKFYQTNHES